MARQPLKSVFPNAQVHVVPEVVTERADLMSKVMAVIGTWSYTDNLLTTILTTFLKGDYEIVSDMLHALSSTVGQRAAIDAAAKASLSEDDYTLYQAVMRVIKPSRDRRNEFAHHIWAYDPKIKTAIFLVNPRSLARDAARQEDYSNALRKSFEQPQRRGQKVPLPEPPVSAINTSEIYSYRKKDLDEELEHATAAHEYVWLLSMAFRDFAVSEKMRTKLCARPPIQQALQRMSNGSDP